MKLYRIDVKRVSFRKVLFAMAFEVIVNRRNMSNLSELMRSKKTTSKIKGNDG